MNKPSRRAVVRTGVRAVPVVGPVGGALVGPGLSAGAPAPGGTTIPAVDIEGMGSGRRLPGHSTRDGQTFYDYKMVVTFDNSTTSPQVITLIDFTISRTAVTGFPTGSRLTLQPGATPETFLVTSSASSQCTATITYQYHGNIYTKMVTFPVLELWDYTPMPTPTDVASIDPALNCA
jgi:hypothetical protein